jgi:hypothetical protein
MIAESRADTTIVRSPLAHPPLAHPPLAHPPND